MPADLDATQFFDAMAVVGFTPLLAEEDTGKGCDALNQAGNPANDLPHGYLSDVRHANPDFDRVPDAFAFRSGDADIVLISVHLHANESDASDRRDEVMRRT